MNIIPENRKGKAVDLEHAVESATEEKAKELFGVACNRLQQPGTWHELGGKLSATFSLVDNKQNKLERPPALYDYIKISIPAPGDDWVQVINIADENNSFGMTLLVAREPGKNTTEVDHFFNEGATSTFLLNREGKKVTATYHGRNETAHTDNLRNAVVALGAMAGFSELQWTTLLKGLLE